MKIEITYGVHEYHIENISGKDDHRDIEVYLDGMFINSYDNICSAIGHCLEQRNFDRDLGYVMRCRA